MAEISLVFASELYRENGHIDVIRMAICRLRRLGFDYMSILDTILSTFICLKFFIIKIFFLKKLKIENLNLYHTVYFLLK